MLLSMIILISPLKIQVCLHLRFCAKFGWIAHMVLEKKSVMLTDGRIDAGRKWIIKAQLNLHAVQVS